MVIIPNYFNVKYKYWVKNFWHSLYHNKFFEKDRDLFVLIYAEKTHVLIGPVRYVKMTKNGMCIVRHKEKLPEINLNPWMCVRHRDQKRGDHYESTIYVNHLYYFDLNLGIK